MIKGLIPFAAVAGLFFSFSCSADFNGVVVRVLDGDTIDVFQKSEQKTQRVRLSGIDAPEKNQPFGQRSRQLLSEMVVQRYVSVKESGKDRYGRILGDVIRYDVPPGVPVIDMGVNVNEIMLVRGLAWAYRYHGKALNPGYEQLEHSARHDHVGLWSESNNIEPWKWREQQKAQK